ncbi:hypothetical protein SCHPADRAFT_410983 [Schizopora paradoxa]|uniref:MYND-type domain-containing protein n=1 Tax=Schizopora paradoxa TaxID=27342 RepID=A0A0H2RLT7_9AGAM|nr:hypothetical protein SCHPADRAFT_410983 [Schizopora paradoxa]
MFITTDLHKEKRQTTQTIRCFCKGVRIRNLLSLECTLFCDASFFPSPPPSTATSGRFWFRIFGPRNMSCADCEHCKADLARYLSDPRKYIASAARNSPESFEDLRTVIYNGGHTPEKYVKETLAMLFAHLSAGDQSTFNPAGPPPPRLRPFEAKAFLSMAGIFTVFNKYDLSGTPDAAPIKTLVENWPKIRKWIQHFFYRALARKVPASEAPITNDEACFAKMGEGWTIFNMVLVIVTYARYDDTFFDSVAPKDGTLTMILKLWARIARYDPTLAVTPIDHYCRATLLFANCLQLSKDIESTECMSTQLVNEMGGDAKAIVVFLTRPLRDAAKMTPSEFSGQAMLLGSSMQLIHRLLDGVMGGLIQRPIFGKAFLEDPKLNPRPLMAKILTKYSAIRSDTDLPYGLREIIRSAFQLCSSLVYYHEAIDFVVHLLDNGLLEVYANLVRGLPSLSNYELRPAAILLKQDISTFLSHECVISAAKNALHRLEKERKDDYLALKGKESGLKDAWLYFTGHAFERATLAGVYNAKFRKEDKLTCGFCHVRMNERMLKKCSRCKFVLYCSQICQTKDWKKDHKQNCKAYAKNLEVYRRKADTEHFFDHLVRSDIRRHIPGLNALAKLNPRTRDADTLLAYCADYTFAPPTFSVFPAADVVDESRYVELGLAYRPESQELRRELLDIVRKAGGKARIVQVEMRGHAGTPIITFQIIGLDDFMDIRPEVPKSFNPERPRAIDQNDNALAVQIDWTDIVMADAIYGRRLTHDEFHMYIAEHVHLGFDDQDKTVFERVDDAVRRRKDQEDAPCCRDRSGHSIC